MSLIQAHRAVVRQNILRPRVAAPVRNSSGGSYRHMPFKHPTTDGTTKKTMAVKTGIFLTLGFTIPAFMAGYSLKKSGGAA